MSGKRRPLSPSVSSTASRLWPGAAISRAEMDVQRANRDAANAALKIAREELAQMSLIAPFSGIAAGVHIRNHQVVAAGQPVITLTRTDLLDVVFSIPENLFTSTDIRNTAYRPVVRINTLPGREFTAEYKEHTGSSDNSTLTRRDRVNHAAAR